MPSLEDRLEELRRLRDAGTITESEHAAARQRAIAESTTGKPGPFGSGSRFGLGGIAALVLAFALFAAGAGVLATFAVHSSGSCSAQIDGTAIPCTTEATRTVAP